MRIRTYMSNINKLQLLVVDIMRTDKKVMSQAFLVLVQCFALA